MKILLATDGSEESELAARAAVELAKSTGSELHLVHVKLIPLTPPYPEVLDCREDLERAEREARELLDERVKMVEEAGGTVAGAHLREERPAEEIVALAEDLGVRLIIVGRRNRGLIRRALAGSVSDSVVRHAHRPVLVVPSHKAADNRARLSRGTWTARPGPSGRLAPGVEAPGEETASSTTSSPPASSYRCRVPQQEPRRRPLGARVRQKRRT